MKRFDRFPILKWLLGAVTLALVIFGVWNLRRSIQNEAPEWLHMKDRTSPSMTIDASFHRLIEESRKASVREEVPLGSIQYLQIEKNSTNAVLWTSEPVVNQGFNPLAHWEKRLAANDVQWVGWYAMDGAPLKFTVRNDPGRNLLWATIHLKDPVASGATQLLFRVQRQTGRIKLDKGGKYSVYLDRLRPVTDGIQARGVRLPAKATLSRYTPKDGAIVSTNDVPGVYWINSRLPANAPSLSLTYENIP